MENWVFGVFALAAPVFLFVIVKIFTAKTHKANLLYFGLAMVLTTVFSAAISLGMKLNQQVLDQIQRNPPVPFGEFLSRVPIPIIISGGVWFVGVNAITIHQMRKARRPWWEIAFPLGLPFRYLNRKAWLAMIVLSIVSLIIASFGLGPTNPTHSP